MHLRLSCNSNMKISLFSLPQVKRDDMNLQQTISQKKERQPRIQANNPSCKAENRFSFSTEKLEAGRFHLSASICRALSACTSRKQKEFWLQDCLLSLSHTFTTASRQQKKPALVLKVPITVTKMPLERKSSKCASQIRKGPLFIPAFTKTVSNIPRCLTELQS